MVSNCLNPDCRVPFSHTRNGRFFSVDHLLSDSHDRDLANGDTAIQVEQYWLCGPCSQVLKVVVENGSIITIPVDVECAALVG